MKNTLIHGENEVAAQARFNELVRQAKSEGYEIIRATDAVGSLFSDKVLFVYENLTKFSQQRLGGSVLILCDAVAPASLLKSLPKDFAIEKFDLPKKLYKFLDNLNLDSFREVIKTEPVELVFAMLGRHLRDLYWASTDPKSLNYPDWRLMKLNAQAKKYNLPGAIARLAEIDRQAKIGEVDLTTALDLFLSRGLE